jgi:hypothetical protein
MLQYDGAAREMNFYRLERGGEVVFYGGDRAAAFKTGSYGGLPFYTRMTTRARFLQ